MSRASPSRHHPPARTRKAPGERVLTWLAGAGWILALVVVFAVLNWGVFAALRALWLPLIRTAAAGSPSAAALITMSLYVVATGLLTTLVTLRAVRKPDRRTLVRRLTVAGVVLLPAVSLPEWGRGSPTRWWFAQVAEHMRTQELADAVVHGVRWGTGGLIVWMVLGFVALYLSMIRRLEGARAETYLAVTGGGLAVYWGVVLPMIAARAATVPLDDVWVSITSWT